MWAFEKVVTADNETGASIQEDLVPKCRILSETEYGGPVEFPPGYVFAIYAVGQSNHERVVR